MQGVDRLFLLTPNSERQVGYILQAVAAARRAGVRRIVRVSVMGADAEPGIILGRQHFAAKREIRASGIGWAMLRPTFFMDNFIRYYGVDPPKDSQVYRPNGDGKAAWVDPDKKGVSKPYIRQAVEDSLRRLQTGYIDLYQSDVDDPTRRSRKGSTLTRS